MEGHTFSPWIDDALLVVDVQRDFLPGGTLAVPAGFRRFRPPLCQVRRFGQHFAC